MARLPFWSQFFLTLALLFWNQIFSWFSERPSSTQRCRLLSSVRYRLPENSARSLFSCSGENAVLGRLSSSLQDAVCSLDEVCSPFGFRGFLIRGPELGRSEYLVQKTQAGHS